MNHPLEEFKQNICTCTNCDLSKSRTNFVFGEGNPDADIMLIGEAPGAREDTQGIPFCGAAGKRLDSVLEHIGLDREDIFIANILKCRPPDNRNPMPSEIKMCTPLLLEQIKIINPKVIVPMGAFAAQYILGTEEKISQLHGHVFEAEAGIFSNTTCKIIPVFHPAATLHNPNLRIEFENDFEKVKAECNL